MVVGGWMFAQDAVGEKACEGCVFVQIRLYSISMP